MKSFLSLLSFIAVFSLYFSSVMPALAETPVLVTHYKTDPKAENGYRQEYQWYMNQNDEWRRFVYLVGKTPTAKKEDISPFLRKPDDMIVLSFKDENGVTGKDYYLSKYGIMVTSILPKNFYYYDTHDFLKFLKEELTQQSSFEKYPGEKISTTTNGIVVRYRINDNLPNPAWLISEQHSVDVYDMFLRNLAVPKPGEINKVINRQSFDEKGYFSLLLNYPKSPAKFATVGADGIRLSRLYSIDTFYKDDKNYFRYFHDMAKESSRTRTKVEEKEKRIIEQGQF